MVLSKSPHFSKIATAAFPSSCKIIAEDAAKILVPFVDNNYHKSSIQIVVLGKTIQIPKRIHFLGLSHDKPQLKNNAAAYCLSTRSTDGYLRQISLRHIIEINEPWSIPFVVLLAGEYVVEIIQDMTSSISALEREAYINFVRENRPVMRLLRAKAASYWNCYYRDIYPDKSTYPGIMFLYQIESWAT